MRSEFTLEDVPQHSFTALCQDPKCRTKLAGIHVPCPMGTITLFCYRCNKVSLFRLEPNQIRAGLVGTFDPTGKKPHRDPGDGLI